MKRLPASYEVATHWRALPALVFASALCLAWGQHAHADQTVVTGNTGTLTANARLNFSIAISKFVLLRVGAADATQSNVTFIVAPNPTIGGVPNNSLGYAGSLPPVLATTVTTTNPTSGAGALVVSAFTNVTGTTLTCTVATLGGATPFAPGSTTAGVPGRVDIKVASAAGGPQHPGTDLSACTGAVSTTLASLTNLTGIFTYSTAYTASTLAAGSYGNQVTYTATTP